jgi:hypothetical protein
VVSKINENKSETYGFDAQTEQYVDMLSAGIVDRRRSCGCLGRGCYDHDRGHSRGGSEEEGGSGHVRRRNGRHRLLISRNIETGAAAVGPPIGCPASGDIFAARPGAPSGATASIGRGHSSDARLSERACSPRGDRRRRRLSRRRGFSPSSRRSRTSDICLDGGGSRVEVSASWSFPFRHAASTI